MANVNTPFGLKPQRGGGAYSFNEQGSLYSIPSTDNNAFYLYDVVKAAASSDANGVSNVTKITNGTDAIRGSIIGILPVYPGVSIAATPLTLETSNIPATKAAAYYVLVDDDPTTMYTVQDNGITTGNLVAASANLNSSLSIAAGATTNSLSGTTLLSSSFATTNTFVMKLFGLAQIPNNAYGAYAKWNARINVSELTGSFAGV